MDWCWLEPCIKVKAEQIVRTLFSACLTTSRGMCRSAKPGIVSRLGEFSARSALVGDTELSTPRATAKAACGATCVDTCRTKIFVQELFLGEHGSRNACAETSSPPRRVRYLRHVASRRESLSLEISDPLPNRSCFYGRSQHGGRVLTPRWGNRRHSGSVRHLTVAGLCLRGTLPRNCRNFKLFLATQLCTVVYLKRDIYLANSIEG